MTLSSPPLPLARKKTLEGPFGPQGLPFWGGYLLSHFRSIIGVVRFNFSVRDGKRWIPDAIDHLNVFKKEYIGSESSLSSFFPCKRRPEASRMSFLQISRPEARLALRDGGVSASPGGLCLLGLAARKGLG